MTSHKERAAKLRSCLLNLGGRKLELVSSHEVSKKHEKMKRGWSISVKMQRIDTSNLRESLKRLSLIESCKDKDHVTH